MSQRANPTAVGLFVLIGLALGVAGILVFGSARWFSPSARFVLYFDSSVKGLAPGAVVAIAGVKVGRVTDIKLRFNQADDDDHLPVIIEVDLARLGRLTDRPLDLENPAAVKRLVERGLRGRLQAESLVTGVLFVELTFLEDPPPPLYHQIQARYLEIPTAPNHIQMVLENLAELDVQGLFTKLDTVLATVGRRLEEFNAAQISAGLTNLLANINRVVSSTEFTNVLTTARLTFSEAGDLSQTLRLRVNPLADNAEAALAEVTRTAGDLRQTSETLRQTLAPQSRLAVELSESLAQLRNASRAIAELADFLQSHPNSLLSGRENAPRRP